MEPFKNFYNKKIISGMGDHFSRAWPDFDRTGFIKAAAKNLATLELKERSNQITEAMARYLPADFEHTAQILHASLRDDDDGDISNATVDERGIAGWAIMPMTHYVGLHGLAHFDTAMHLFKELTKRFTSEFGIRFFLLAEPKRTLTVLKTWTDDPSRHVRRLVSEGTRPRLPWAMQLPAFIENPAPLIKLLEALKDDKEAYVRRSVANHLNDISKDHPERVAKIAQRWMRGADTEREKLVRHACRSLIKQGHTPTLSALGYGAPRIKVKSLEILTPRLHFGQALEFALSIRSSARQAQALIIDYAIHHRKANGQSTPKVFKWKTLTLDAGATLTATRKHAIRKISTRVYYPGAHAVEILVNGQSMGKKSFELFM